jgi:hypothetical protein
MNQRIELTMDNIVVDAGMEGKLTLRAGPSEITMDEEGITFSVLNGMSFISMAADGITMFGTPTVQLNPMGSPAPAEEAPAEADDTATS